MKHFKIKILIGVVVALGALYNNALANVVFDGGFETGDHSQWSDLSWNLSRPEAEQFEIVTDITRRGTYAAKMTVHDGDEFLDTGGERVQLERPDAYNENEGDEYWYSWSTFFPADWQNLTNAPDDWLVIADWHASNSGGFENICQPLQIEINANNQLIATMLSGDVTGYDCFNGAGTAHYHDQVIVDGIELGKWNDFRIHVKWTVEDTGLVEIWHKTNDENTYTQVFNQIGVPTRQYIDNKLNDDSPYFILAHYRSEEQAHTSVLYQDAFKQGTTLNDIDEDAPVIVEVTPVDTPTIDDTPEYTFNSTEAGSIVYGGDCSSVALVAVPGDNTVTFDSLSDGTHSNCTISVDDAAGNTSNTINVSSFVIAASPNRGNGTPIGNLAVGTTETTISLDTSDNANCRYSTIANTTYGDMVDIFATTGGVNHEQLVTGLNDGIEYHYYVRCIAGGGIVNGDDFEIVFNVDTTCTGFTYNNWGVCQTNGRQSRTATIGIPDDCVGGTPVLEQDCTYIGKNFNKFTPKIKLKGIQKKYKLKKNKRLYIKRKKFSFSGKTKELISGKVQLFIDGDMEDEDIIDNNGRWKVSGKVKKNSSHKIRFKYFDKQGNFMGKSSKYRIKVDTRKPRFINLPKFLRKQAGDKVAFKVMDGKTKSNKTVKKYKYLFNGKRYKTKKSEFIIPAKTPRGLYALKIKAYDRAGNKARGTILIRVR